MLLNVLYFLFPPLPLPHHVGFKTTFEWRHFKSHSKEDASVIFRDAALYNMTDAGHVWIVTEQALFSNNVPIGTLGLKLNNDNETEHIRVSRFDVRSWLDRWKSVFVNNGGESESNSNKKRFWRSQKIWIFSMKSSASFWEPREGKHANIDWKKNEIERTVNGSHESFMKNWNRIKIENSIRMKELLMERNRISKTRSQVTMKGGGFWNVWVD